MPPENFHEGAPWWGLVSPDKTTLRVDASILNLEAVKPYQQRGPVTITNAGGTYWDFGFHSEAMLPGIPLIVQMGNWFGFAALLGVFRFDVAIRFMQVLLPYWTWDQSLNVVAFTEYLGITGFVLAEREIATDFPCHNRPVRLAAREDGHKFRSTLYSNDGVRTRRWVERNGKMSWQSKGSRKDTVAEYNRAKKTNSPDPLWRVELRLQRHHLDRLSLFDLALDFHSWLIVRHAYLVKFLKKAVRPGSWTITEAHLEPGHWPTRQIFLDSGWVVDPPNKITLTKGNSL